MRWWVYITLGCVCAISPAGAENLQQALQWYRQGEVAESVEEREDAFNRALFQFAEAERSTQDPNGALLYNIGNCYYHLGEYVWALLYYERALSKLPRSERVQLNLRMTKQQLDLPAPPLSYWDRYLRTTRGEKMRVFTLLLLAGLLFGSLSIWLTRGRIYSRASRGCFALALLPLMFVLGQHYFGSIDALVVQTTELYRDAGSQYAAVIPKPLALGEKVQVLETLEEGSWLKVNARDGTIGYVPYEVVRII